MKLFLGFIVGMLCYINIGFAQIIETKIVPNDPNAYDLFGNAVSISGDYAIVAALKDDDNGFQSGSAYIFHREGTNWTQQAKLIANDGNTNDEFGHSVSISGEYAIVGANKDDDLGNSSGSAYIFHRTDSAWVQQVKLLANDGVQGDGFGWSVSISGNYAIIGAPSDDDNGASSGSAYIFHRVGSSWTQHDKLLPNDGVADADFGYSVSISGDYAIIGASNDNINGVSIGSAYVFYRSGSGWVQQGKLLSNDGFIDDDFGWSVSISGDYAVIGAPGDDDNGDFSGSVYSFKRNGTNWIQHDKLTASDGNEIDVFGRAVSISANFVIVGAYLDDDNGNESGSAYIFRDNESNWVQQNKLLLSDGDLNDRFGYSVAISGAYALVGAYTDNEFGVQSGSAYVYTGYSGADKSIVILSPSGGERWESGSIKTISWATVNVDSIRIEFSIDNGNNWSEITSATPAAQVNFDWTVPNSPTEFALISITDVEDASVSDTLDETFRISENIILTSPNGGESWEADSTEVISWLNIGIDSIKIEYSTDNGKNFQEIVSAFPADSGNYNWIVRNTPSDSVLVKIISIHDSTINDISDGILQIIKHPETTIITHGFVLDAITPTINWSDYKWPFAMADAISADRQICFIREGVVYRTYLDYNGFSAIPDDENINTVITTHFTTDLNLDETKNVVFVSDWVEESDINKHGYLEAAADVFASALVNTAIEYPLLLNKLHFIGHSRGTIVNSEIIQRLIYWYDKNLLPNGINLDTEMHMTTLDPHPAGHWVNNTPFDNTFMNDDDVNNFAPQNNIGVVGWKTANNVNTVKYIDNFYQTHLASFFIGLSNYPGLDTQGSFANNDLTPRFEDPLSAHSLVHTWYHGTVDTLQSHINDGFNTPTGTDIIRDVWYIDSEGKLEGYYYSRIRDGNIDFIESIPSDLVNINNDRNYGDFYLIFNGDFSKRSLDINILTPGWDFQGGEGDGFIDIDEFGGLNSHLELDFGNSSKKHNWFYLPIDAKKIYFRLSVRTSSNTDGLEVKLGENSLKYISLADEFSYRVDSVNVQNYSGTVERLSFSIDPNGGIVDSEVWIDDISFYKKSYINAILADQEVSEKLQQHLTITYSASLHAYDSNGNHTGPTSDSTFVVDIPGSEYHTIADSLGNRWQEIILPQAPDGIYYRFEVLAENGGGNFDFQIEDIKPSDFTATANFNDLTLSETSAAEVTLQNVSPNINLELDTDGDGSLDSLVSPSFYQEMFEINASVEANGTIVPEGAVLVNYDSTLSFTIIPDIGYQILDVLVDGVSVGQVSEYTFTNINSNHTIIASFTELSNTFTFNANSGWNLVGLPFDIEDTYYLSIFPNASSNSLFGFNGSYILEDTLELGIGYWINFPTAENVLVQGLPVNSVTIDLSQGWNLIAGISFNVPLSNVSDPGGIIIPGTLFGFEGSYVSSDTLKQGKGYWINASTAGQITINSAVLAKQNVAPFFKYDLSRFSSIQISDASGANQTLYFNVVLEDSTNKAHFILPPVPPVNMFDARFTGDYRISEGDESIIHLQTSYYPIKISVSNLPNKEHQYAIVEMLGNEEKGKHIINENQIIEIANSQIKKLKLSKVKEIPAEFMVSQNFPNPFNPITKIRYGIPQAEKVEIHIYNTLGQKVKTLVSELKKAGFYTVVWDGTNNANQTAASGIYIYTLKAGKHRAIKKMILLK